MGIRELREAYGKNLKARQAINKAIRAELPGGSQCLDASHLTHKLVTSLRREGHTALATQAQEVHDLMTDACCVMADDIGKTYELSSYSPQDGDVTYSGADSDGDGAGSAG